VAEESLKDTQKEIWMKILLKNIGKKYQRDWIFRHIDYEFISGATYAILGNNGSGKSTLLQTIIGATQHSEGSIEYQIDHTSIVAEKAFQSISFAAPYLELVEEMTLAELFAFHKTFKPLINTITEDTMIELAGLTNARKKQIATYSSGMKQRLKLILAFFSQSDLLCLDEPTSNLDALGIDLYQLLIQQHLYGRTLIVASNDEAEYHFCDQKLCIFDYKN
jgi:ABC-type multidrug transport system ATPase subunit